MTIGVLIVHFVKKVPKFVQMIFTIYRVQAYQVTIVNSRWPPKIQDGSHEIQFFDISTPDCGDFPRIIEIALLSLFSFSYIISDSCEVIAKAVSFLAKLKRMSLNEMVRPNVVKFVL